MADPMAMTARTLPLSRRALVHTRQPPRLRVDEREREGEAEEEYGILDLRQQGQRRGLAGPDAVSHEQPPAERLAADGRGRDGAPRSTTSVMRSSSRAGMR
jgi:hypothetical protein